MPYNLIASNLSLQKPYEDIKYGVLKHRIFYTWNVLILVIAYVQERTLFIGTFFPSHLHIYIKHSEFTAEFGDTKSR